MRKFSKIMICIGALIMIILGMIVHDTWKDRIYFSLAVLFVTALSLLWNIVVQNLMEKINKKKENK
ncbi:Group-specific protein [Bacillus wiedmannii]